MSWPHSHRADPREERPEAVFLLFGGAGREQPVQRVVLVGDETVDARCGVVLRLGHLIRLARHTDAVSVTDP